MKNLKQTALFIVDMQQGVVANAYMRDDVIANIKQLVERARANKTPIFWIFHSSDEMKEDSASWQLVSELKPYESENIIKKKYGDSFEDTALESELKKLDVKRVVVTGAQTDACIRATIHGAFVRGYDTVLVSDAHTTEDLTAYGLPAPEKLIAFTNIYWTWQSAPNRIASVVKTSELN